MLITSGTALVLLTAMACEALVVLISTFPKAVTSAKR
jgi:hypothetical protein